MVELLLRVKDRKKGTNEVRYDINQNWFKSGWVEIIELPSGLSFACVSITCSKGKSHAMKSLLAIESCCWSCCVNCVSWVTAIPMISRHPLHHSKSHSGAAGLHLNDNGSSLQSTFRLDMTYGLGLMNQVILCALGTDSKTKFSSYLKNNNSRNLHIFKCNYAEFLCVIPELVIVRNWMSMAYLR